MGLDRRDRKDRPVARRHGGGTGAPFATDSVLVSTFAYDAEQDTLSVASFTQPAHGSVTHNGDGSFTYTAAGGYTGSDVFTAVITDGRGGFTDTTVKLLVTGPPPPGSANRTTTFTDFQAIEAGGAPIALGGWRVPRAIDWNNDGDQDLLIGDDSGIWRYGNIDHLAVAWGPDPSQVVIPGSALQTIDFNPPVVANPVADVVVVEDAADTVLELSNVFSDPDLQDSVSLELTGNSNSALVGAILAGTQLTLAYAAGQSGTAAITIRAADLGGALVTDTFTVTVQSDNDGDGDPDLTDPDDRNSKQNFTVVPDPGTGEPSVRFHTSANRLYTVETHDNLTTGPWQDLNPTRVPGTGSQMTIGDPASLPHRFYRLRVEVP
jgi:hypothetical protein